MQQEPNEAPLPKKQKKRKIGCGCPCREPQRMILIEMPDEDKEDYILQCECNLCGPENRCTVKLHRGYVGVCGNTLCGNCKDARPATISKSSSISRCSTIFHRAISVLLELHYYDLNYDRSFESDEFFDFFEYYDFCEFSCCSRQLRHDCQEFIDPLEGTVNGHSFGCTCPNGPFRRL